MPMTAPMAVPRSASHAGVCSRRPANSGTRVKPFFGSAASFRAEPGTRNAGTGTAGTENLGG
eukprot:CAMPEP_0179306702 /NCGR_PEP_ID=MMETSP0797-20121207/50267_1 /TAXON_ID=47934 /ORGANISM="Dinophysis acuminata, Strain DAEP01" /LENGTH=61 /DNA_ID=CAMNT_0021016373 /DNA_START=38 /DNA_END=219 /DNA_ORIENTATION=+